MSKPAGIYIGLDGKGDLTMGVTRSDRVMDAIWDAVEEAVAAGWTVARFKSEAWQAWEEAKTQEVKRDNAEWKKP